MKTEKFIVCECGCGREAEWLCAGFDYDPQAPNGLGKPFIDAPCCESSAAYLSVSYLSQPTAARVLIKFARAAGT